MSGGIDDGYNHGFYHEPSWTSFDPAMKGSEKTGYRYTIDDRYVFFTEEPLTDEELEALTADPELAIEMLKVVGFHGVKI